MAVKPKELGRRSVYGFAMAQSQGGKAVKRYKIERLKVSGPIYGFLIHTPRGKTMRDIYPNTIAKELNRLNNRIKRLEEALESIREYWNRDNNNRALVDACWYAIDTASEVLEAKEAKP
jgi:hypothetical protein